MSQRRRNADPNDDRPITGRGYYSVSEEDAAAARSNAPAPSRFPRNATEGSTGNLNAHSQSFHAANTASDARGNVEASKSTGVMLPGAVSPDVQARSAQRGNNAGYYELSAAPVYDGNRSDGEDSQPRTGGGPGKGRRKSSTTIGRVSGLPEQGSSLRGVAVPDAQASILLRATDDRSRKNAAEPAPAAPAPSPAPVIPAPPELAVKLLSLVEKLVLYKSRLAKEQAAREIVEGKLRELHMGQVAPLKAEIHALEDAALSSAQEQAGIGRAAAGLPSGGYGDPLHWESAEMHQQFAVLDDTGAAMSRDQLQAKIDAAAEQRTALYGKSGLGGGVGQDVQVSSMAAQLQPDPLAAAQVLVQSRRALLAEALSHRAAARAVLLEGANDAEGADVLQAAVGAGMEGVSKGSSVLDNAPNNAVDAVVARLEQEKGANRSVPYAFWLEQQRLARAGSQEEEEASSGMAAFMGKAWATLQWQAHWMVHLFTSGAIIPLRAGVAWVSSHHGSTGGAAASLQRHAFMIFLTQSIIAILFSIHHWRFGNFNSGAGVSVLQSALQPLLPSSYSTAEGSVLAAQLICLFAVALCCCLYWWVTADRRQKAHVALDALAGKPGMSRAVLGAVDLRGYSSASEARQGAVELGGEMSALLLQGVHNELQGVAPPTTLQLYAKRAAGSVMYFLMVLWLAYLTAQSMLAGSMAYRLAAGMGVDAEKAANAGAGWGEIITPALCAVLLWLFSRTLPYLSSFERWDSPRYQAELHLTRLWFGYILVAVLQILGYVLIADPMLLRAPFAAFSDAFPAALHSTDSVVQQLQARLVLARPFYPSLLAGGARCRLDAASAGLWRLIICQFIVNRLGALLQPVVTWAYYRAGRPMLACFRACMLPGVGTTKADGPADYQKPEHRIAESVGETCQLMAFGLANVLFSPMSSLLAALLSWAAFHCDLLALQVFQGKARTWPGGGRHVAPLMHTLLLGTCIIMCGLQAGILSSSTIPTSCTTAARSIPAVYSVSPIVRGTDAYCTAVADSLPTFAKLHGWERVLINGTEAESPWYRFSESLFFSGSRREQRRYLLQSVPGEETTWWFDNQCVPQCKVAQELYKLNHTGLAPTDATDVVSDPNWCNDHCGGYSSILPHCPGQGNHTAPLFSFRWPTTYTPLDKSTWTQPFGVAADYPTSLLAVNVTRPCDLSCGAWTQFPSGMAALEASFVAANADFAAFLWAVVHNRMVLWVSLLVCFAWGFTGRNSAAVSSGLASEQVHTLSKSLDALDRTVQAQQARLRAYKATAAQEAGLYL